jgi:uncharacterized damage-inducible protein DinB
MDDPKAIFLTIFITVLVVVIINYGIIRRFSGKGNGEASYWSKTIDAAKDPWKKEDDEMDELSRLVEGIKREAETEERNRQNN